MIAHTAALLDREYNPRAADELQSILIKLALTEDDGLEHYEDPPRLHGEWWVDHHGTLEYADGDVGDAGHDIIAGHHIYNQFDFPEFNFDHFEGYISPEQTQPAYDSYLEGEAQQQPSGTDVGEWVDENHDYFGFMVDRMGQPHYDAFHGKQGAQKEFVIQHYGWIAIRQHHLDVWKLTPENQMVMASALEEAYDEDAENGRYTIHEYSTGKTITNVTLDQLNSGTVGAAPDRIRNEFLKPTHAPFAAYPSGADGGPSTVYKDWRA